MDAEIDCNGSTFVAVPLPGGIHEMLLDRQPKKMALGSGGVMNWA